MIAHPFRYCCPTTLAEAVRVMADHGTGAAVLAGGTWLVPQMSRAERRPDVVVDLRRLGLTGIAHEGDRLVLGASTNYEQLKSNEIIRQRAPVLRIMAEGITGGQGVTAQGTIGGAACFGNPSSDVPGTLMALGARMRLASVAGTRDVTAQDFFTGPFQTARRPDEVLVAIVVEAAAEGAYAGYHKLKLSGSSWPVVTAACCVQKRDGSLHARLSIGAAGPVPVAAEAILPPAAGTATLLSLADAAVANLSQGWSDELADAEYRLAVAPTVARRAVAALRESMDA